MALFQAPQLNDEQQAAVQTALAVAADCGHMALIGPAGTGKTTTIRAIAHALQRISPAKSVLLLAPTHKARRQLQAARLPRGAQAWTVQKFCQVRPEQWRDQDKFRMTGNQLQMIQQLQSKFSFVIVDESSMVASELAAAVVDTAMHAGVPVMFAGDPYQLPPADRQEVEYDEFADNGPETAMASEFVDAPVIARLSRVMRHGGPVLSFATSIRDDWSTLHSFPEQPAKDDESEIRLSSSFEDAFIVAFSDSFDNYADEPEALYKAAPRALCYMNSTVRDLTRSLRERIYGGAAMVTWQPGELITFKDYTKTDVGFIHSSADAIVIDSEVVELPKIQATVGYVTPATNRSKTLTMSFSATVQRISVQPMNPDGTPDSSGVHTVHAPLCGDTAPIDRYRELKQALMNRRLGADHAGWKWLKQEVKEQYLNVIYSAFVMTVHKSQGSTFRDVFVHRDLLRVGEDDRERRNALLYVAATRASKSLTFGAANAHV
jgi:exodeoxyribonuclease-5